MKLRNKITRELKFRRYGLDGFDYFDLMRDNFITFESFYDTATAKNHDKIEQYTGLKDKHCVEIYEGDIVSCCDFNFLIVWREYDSSFIMEDDEDKISLPLYANLAKDIEVIGNKYEDSYLLGDHK